MPFDPTRHHRRSIRLRGYDYSLPGAYFVTICARERRCLFGKVVDNQAYFTQAGELVVHSWDSLPQHFPEVELNAFVLMPNHIHAIIVLEEHASASTVMDPKRPTLGQVVAFFKYQTTKGLNELWQTPGEPVWQRNYFEHVIRNEASLRQLREYVTHNAAHWQQDSLYSDDQGSRSCPNRQENTPD
jgi:putative transposase